MEGIDVRTRNRQHTGRVFYDRPTGRWSFVIVGSDGEFIAGGGANTELPDGELPDVNRLVAASSPWIDWRLEVRTQITLRQIEQERYSPEVRRLFV